VIVSARDQARSMWFRWRVSSSGAGFYRHGWARACAPGWTATNTGSDWASLLSQTRT
jgi:hypothetical protein